MNVVQYICKYQQTYIKIYNTTSKGMYNIILILERALLSSSAENQCINSPDICGTALCVSIPPSYICACPAGMTLDMTGLACERKPHVICLNMISL